MRKILGQAERNKKNKRNQLFMGLILIFLMVFSTLGFAFGNSISGISNTEEIEHKGVEFIRDSNTGFWSFNIQDINFLTTYNPTEVDDIFFSNYQTIQGYTGKPLYFVGDSTAFSEFDRNLRGRFVVRINNACLSDECEGDFPVKDCSRDNIIIIREPVEGEFINQEEIYEDENCVYIIANTHNQIRYADAYLFELLGIK